MSPTSVWDDGRPRVTWRGDGQFVAVSAVCPETGMGPNLLEMPTCVRGFLHRNLARQELAGISGLLAT